MPGWLEVEGNLSGGQIRDSGGVCGRGLRSRDLSGGSVRGGFEGDPGRGKAGRCCRFNPDDPSPSLPAALGPAIGPADGHLQRISITDATG